MKHVGDITKLSGAALESVDCITGGSPCQDLSIAGPRDGLDGERSGLFMEQIRIVKELRQHDGDIGRTGIFIRPRFMVWENVPGAFSSNGGRDFQTVLSEIVRIAEPGAPDVPLPKKWPLADSYHGDGWSVAYRVHDAEFWGTPQRRRRIALVADFGGHAAPEVLFERESVSGNIEPGGPAREETAGAAGSGVDEAGKRGGAISFQERAGKPGGGKGILIQNERTGALSTLNNQSVLVMAHGQANAEICADMSPTLNCNHEQPICIQGNAIDRGDTSGCGGKGWLEGVPFTENPRDRHAVAWAGIVRRLTPLECERLQGFPDGWTDIGDWTDATGKKHRDADSPRYKAIGNSIALPFWFWLLRRISALYARPATLGSLFDGIGGFPLCWERCNGPGTARWASEIEQFPIAVTKARFGEN